MWVWRLTKATRPTFDGQGARLYGGRWNHAGLSGIYTSESISLAVLEFFVHLAVQDPPALVTIRAEVPADLEIGRVDRDSLPADWRQTPAPSSLADLGTAWARAARTAVLVVPSAIVPTETNYVLNPAHPDFKRIKVARPEPFSLDPRMLRRSGRRAGRGGAGSGRRRLQHLL